MNQSLLTPTLVKRTGLKRLRFAAEASMQGLVGCFRTEASFRQEVVVGALLLPVIVLLPCTVLEKALLFTSLLLVLAVELLNSAIEAVVDLVSPEWHPLAGRAKDAGSAAVLVCIVICIVVWVAVLHRVVTNLLSIE